MDLSLRIELLGGLRVQTAAPPPPRAITRFRTRKTALLLAYLAYYHERPHSRELLVDLLWPECGLDSGRHNLSMALSSLRQQLEPAGVPDGAVLVADRETVGLNRAAVTTDVSEFERALKLASRARDAAEQVGFLHSAVEVYAGELLPGHRDDWIYDEQQRLDELYFQTLRTLARHHEQRADFDRALCFALRALGADRVREEAHREVIRLYAESGQHDLALRQYRELERILKRELDSAPSSETREIIRGIAADRTREAVLRASAPPARPAEDPPKSPCRPELQLVSMRRRVRTAALEPVGGAVPLHSRLYVVRPADQEFRSAIARRDSIVIVKGPRQVGKTSLLARGLEHARAAGCRVVLSNLRMINAAQRTSAEALLRTLAQEICDQVEIDVPLGDAWDDCGGPNLSFRRFLRREVLGKLSSPLVWCLDEVDCLFPYDYGNEIFALFRSWHDERALEPAGPWSRLTLAMACSTEAHLLINDVYRSPFNVGARLELEDFVPDQVEELNHRHGDPLEGPDEVVRYCRLVGGHPYLVRRGLYEMAAHGIPLAALEARATAEEGIFGEHLRRLLLLARDPELGETVLDLLRGRPCPSREAFYRLRSAGLLSGESAANARFRCQLYAAYLRQQLL